MPSFPPVMFSVPSVSHLCNPICGWTNTTTISIMPYNGTLKNKDNCVEFFSKHNPKHSTTNIQDNCTIRQCSYRSRYSKREWRMLFFKKHLSVYRKLWEERKNWYTIVKRKTFEISNWAVEYTILYFVDRIQFRFMCMVL